MNYRTTCPRCASVFRLGTDQLDAVQGWVQCSVCGTAFDARPSLLMEDGSPLPIAAAPEPAEPTPPTEIALPGTPSADVATPDAASPDEAPAIETQAADTPRGIAERAISLDLPSIIIIDPDIPVSDDPGPMPNFYPAPASARESAAAAPFAPVVPTKPSMPAARVEYPTSPPATARVPRRRGTPWVWGFGAMLLLLLLFAQTAYFLRDALVSRLPQTRPVLEQACALLGCTLSLPKNLASLQVVGSDLQSEASGRLNLVLTLGNRANEAQAWPVLVLTLNDQRNRPLARRSFAPSEYLDDAERIAAGIPPRSEQALSLPLSVRDLTPMGFDLQLAY